MDDTRGCLFVTGLVITSTSVGCLAGWTWGWLTAGCIILAVFVLECIAEIIARCRRGSDERN
jgi:hypothetical protein